MGNVNSPWPADGRKVKIFKIERMGRNYRLSNYVGEFEGRIEHDLKSEYASKAIRVVIHDGTFIGYAPAERVMEILDFIGHRESYPCKGNINRNYDRASECFYFWGECVISENV